MPHPLARFVREVSPGDNSFQHTQAHAAISFQIIFLLPGHHLISRILKQVDEAIKVYEQGMETAKNAGDNFAYGELRNAYDELVL